MEENSPRVSFPGFVFTEAADTSTHEVEKGYFEVGGTKYDVDLIRSRKASPRGSFLPASVRVDDQQVWSFQQEGFNGLALMVVVGNLPVVCLCDTRKRELADIRPLPDIGKIQKFSSLGRHAVIRVRGLLEIARLKREAARVLKLTPVFTDEEKTAVDAASREAKEARLAAEEKRKAEEAARHEEREAKRREQVALILSRQQIHAFTDSGIRRFGHPVVGEEWKSLSSGTRAIAVTSYDDTADKCGELLEAFIVSKGRNGRAERKVVVAVTREHKLGGVSGSRSEMPAPKEILPIKVGGEYRQVLLFKDIESVRKARKTGLNGGIYVACEEADNLFQVYRTTEGGGMDPVIRVKRVSVG